MTRRAGMIAATALALASVADAAEHAVVYNYAVGGKFDKSYAEAAYLGVVEARRRLNAEIVEYEPRSPADETAFIREAAGVADHVVVLGFVFADRLRAIAPNFPTTRFTIVDAAIDAENVSSIVFAEEEVAFLVGALAAQKSESGVVGFIGGREIPVIARFREGFRRGAQYARPYVSVLAATVGDGQSAFGDPFAGWRVAHAQIDDGADVVFAAAGASGLGSYLAADERGVFAIGVDSNQNYLHPGVILTSALKRVDRAVTLAVERIETDAWRPTVSRLGLADGGVDYAVDDHNAGLIEASERALLEGARRAIVDGAIMLDAARAGAP